MDKKNQPINKETLLRYINQCNNIIAAKDTERAKKLEERIVAVLQYDVEGIAFGLDDYSFIDGPVDYLGDLDTIRERLIVEYERLGGHMETSKSNMVFISHSSQDIEYIREIVSLLEYIGLREDDMVCSSVPDYGIPLGEDIYDWLREKFKTNDLHVLFVLSHNFYNSAACLNEMGAAWVLKQKYDIILLPGFGFEDLKGAVNKNQIGIRIDGDPDEIRHMLGQLKDRFIKEFRLREIPQLRWEKKRDDFIEKMKHIKPNKTAEKGQIVSLSKEACILLAYASKDETGRIVVTRDILSSIPSIETCGKNFTETATVKDFAYWDDAIRKLELYSLIQDTGFDGKVYIITRAGYEAAEKIFEEYKELDTEKDPMDYIR